MMLYSTFPKVLARPGAVQPEYKRVLLLPTLKGKIQKFTTKWVSDEGLLITGY